MLSACKLYISEGRSSKLVTSLKDLACKQQGVAFLDAHVDAPYNRTGIILAAKNVDLVGKLPSVESSSKAEIGKTCAQALLLTEYAGQLADGATNVAREGLELLDLDSHVATHPRIGVIDHISCSPLLPSSLELSVQLAKKLGKRLAGGDAAVPVFLYGYAHPERRSLAEIRRRLGYFKGASRGSWGDISAFGSLDEVKPDYGPSTISSKKGVVTIGATPWITNYNILLDTMDLAIAREFAKAISQRGGGIAGVESMALKHEKGTEIACNLSGPSAELQHQVLDAVSSHSSSHGIEVLNAYIIGKTVEEYSSMATMMLAPDD